MISLAFMCSIQELQSLHLLLQSLSTRLLVRLDSELVINLKLSINVILYVTVLSFSSFF